MAHQRHRFATEKIKRLARLWPVSGVLGARQTGKTTLLRSQVGIRNIAELDDNDTREEAIASAKSFLEKRGTPLLIDEIQKAPKLFDAIKLRVDRKRIPGSYYVTGSTEFSQKLGIQESLTGRIGTILLHPLTYAEANQLSPPPLTRALFHGKQPRLKPEGLVLRATQGGMPVPMFLRDDTERSQYWENWIETTAFRDVARAFNRAQGPRTSYDPEVTLRILREMGQAFRGGEIPSLQHFSLPAQKLRKYLSAMEACFVIRRFAPHPRAIGTDTWLLLDSGLARYLMGTDVGEGPMLSLIRHCVWNEISANSEYFLKTFRPSYYKSARGTPVDWIDEEEGIAYKVLFHGRGSPGQLSYAERSLAGALKSLGLKRGFLITPIERPDVPKGQGIGILPWSYWS